MQIGEYIDSYSPVIDSVVTCIKLCLWLNRKTPETVALRRLVVRL